MAKTSHVRINITLKEETVSMLESVADKGSRSSFIDKAIREQVGKIKKRGLRVRLKEGAIERAERDVAIAEEWSKLEDSLWQD